MKLFCWTPDMVRFMRDASEFGSYHRELAGHIAPLLSPEETLCDAGCGLGYLSLALSPHCRQITAVDLSAPAVQVLRDNLAKAGVSNVQPVCADLRSLQAEAVFDTMVFCLYGAMDETLALAARRCRKRAVFIKRNHPGHRLTLSGGGQRHRTFPDALAFLRARGVPFRQESVTLRMDQPFRTLEDAARFFRIYSCNTEDAALTPEEVLPRLLPCSVPEFPWVFPVERPLGIITVDAAALPHPDILTRGDPQ